MKKSIKEVQTNEVVVNTAGTYDEQLGKFNTMSAKIKFLNSKNLSAGAISKYLTNYEGKLVRYQWVRNVLNTPVTNPKEKIEA